jgi:ribosome biogenesis GTPase A
MAKKNPSYTVIDNREFRGTQSRNLVRILKTENERKLRISIKRDSYDFQSHAKIELWSDAEGKWNFVHSIPFAEMACVKSALTGKIEEDAAELLRMALLIVE